VECSRLEQEVIKRVKRARLFVWLREHRHELFDEDLQHQLAQAYQESPKGQPPVPPARLGLATILQAYTGASDDEVLEATVMDRRWQLVLDCMDHATAPFSKGTLVGFRARLIEHGLDRRLVERTVALYGQLTGRVAAGKLRAALDSSPLWGAGRVEDTINLLGHALRKALGVLARQQGWGLAEGTGVLATRAGVPMLAGPASRPRWIATGMILPPASRHWQWSWRRSGRSSDSPPPSPALRTRGWPGVGSGPAGPRPRHRRRC
jgi:transposase